MLDEMCHEANPDEEWEGDDWGNEELRKVDQSLSL